jgi:hypothetical protein
MELRRGYREGGAGRKQRAQLVRFSSSSFSAGGDGGGQDATSSSGAVVVDAEGWASAVGSQPSGAGVGAGRYQSSEADVGADEADVVVGAGVAGAGVDWLAGTPWVEKVAS